MDTLKQFASEWQRNGTGWWVRSLQTLAHVSVAVGTLLAIGYFYDEPAELAVPLLLAGVALCLIILVSYVEGILVDLEYLQQLMTASRDEKVDRHHHS